MSDMPYVGLRPFNEKEADIFFGRDDHANELLEKIGKQHFTAVLGLSGCGKSSLICAGVIPKIEMGSLVQAGVYWRIVTMRPGNAPFRHLAEELLTEQGIQAEYKKTLFEDDEPTPELMAAFLEGSLRNSLTLQEALEGLNIPERTNILLVVDQFEEIFSFRDHSNRNEANEFVDFLLASSEAQSRVYIVLTMRSEYIGESAKFYNLAEKINSSSFLVPRLTRHQLKEAIVKPMQIYEGSIDEKFVERLLNDANNQPDQLPLIQHLLMGMWNRARYKDFVETDENKEPSKMGIHITDELYDQWGKLEGSLSNHIEKVYSRTFSEDVSKDLDKAEQLVDTYLEESTKDLPFLSSIELENIVEKAQSDISKKLDKNATNSYVTALFMFCINKYCKAGRKNVKFHLKPSEDIVNDLDKVKQLIIEYLFRNLVEVNENVDNIRRAARLGDVAELAKPVIEKKLGKENIAYAYVIKLFIEVVEEFRKRGRRFLEPRLKDEPKLSEDSLISITHESLIRRWRRLQDWRDTEQKYANLYLSLEEDFIRWEEEGKKKSDLLKGSKLALATEWLEAESPTKIWVKRYNNDDADTLFQKVCQYISKSEAGQSH